MAPIEHIKNFLEGFGSAIDIAPRRGYLLPGGFSTDAKNMAADSAMVSRSMNRKAATYGK